MSTERRRAPRFVKRLSVYVRELEMFSGNLSATGMQLICPQAWLSHIESQLESKSLLAGIQISEQERLDVEASVAYVSEAEDEALIGLHFERFAADAKQRWLQYIETTAGAEYLVL